jgi:hypothetical protein
MKPEQHIEDLTAIRTMMERSTKFLSLTGWSGIMAGIYALGGALIANALLPADGAIYDIGQRQEVPANVSDLFLLAFSVLVLAIGTAVFLSVKKSKKIGETLWNPSARRLAVNMAIPLLTGGLFILILLAKGLIGLVLPSTLIFYGLTLLNASKFTYEEIKYLGVIDIALGLIAFYFTEYSLLVWSIGFGAMHIIAGIYLHLTYDK